MTKRRQGLVLALAALIIMSGKAESADPYAYTPVTGFTDITAAVGRPDPRPTVEPSASPSGAAIPTEPAEPQPRTPQPTPQPAPARPPSVSDAKAYALKRLGPQQYACLDAIATRESHWGVTNRNKSSGAYGIPQALPGSRMAKYGSDWTCSYS